MSIVSSQIAGVVDVPNGMKKLLMQAVDQTGRLWERRPTVSSSNDDAATLTSWVVELEDLLPDTESYEESARAQQGKRQDAQHQPQADLDRKTLNELMQLKDSLAFSSTLPWFRDFEVRAGANANARANYLGVPKADYDLVATRYNQITGAKSGLEADASRVWSGGVW